MAVSSKLPAIVADSPNLFAKCIAENHGLGAFETIGQATMYGYALPLHRESKIAGVLTTFYDASYIEAQSARIWRNALWHVVAEVLLIILIIFLVIRWTIVGPIIRMAQWMRDLRARTRFICSAGHNLAMSWRIGFRPNVSSIRNRPIRRKGTPAIWH